MKLFDVDPKVATTLPIDAITRNLHFDRPNSTSFYRLDPLIGETERLHRFDSASISITDLSLPLVLITFTSNLCLCRLAVNGVNENVKERSISGPHSCDAHRFRRYL